MKILAAISIYLGLFFVAVSLLVAATRLPDDGTINMIIWVVLLVLGIAGILTTTILRWRDVLQALTSRSTALGFNMAIVIVVVIAIVVLINAIVAQRDWRVDMDEYGLNSLTAETRSFLDNLDEDVHLEYFFSQRLWEERGRAEQLFEEFQRNSDHITFHFTNIDQEPGAVDRYALSQYPSIVVSAEEGEKFEIITRVDEEVIANAIVKITREVLPTVYFTVGHGELTPDAPPGASLAQVIEQDGYPVESLRLSQVAEIPDASAIVISLLPQTEFFDQELEVLENFLNNGGRYLVALRANWRGVEMNSGLVNLLANYGLEADNAVLIDAAQNEITQLMALFGGMSPLSPILEVSQDHVITRKVVSGGTGQLQVQNARAFKAMASIPPEIRVTPLLRGSEMSWGETNFQMLERQQQAQPDEGVDMLGPVSAAVAITKMGDGNTPETRIVVLGDLQNIWNQSAAFFFNSINWLGDQGDLISVERDFGEFKVLNLTENEIVLLYGVTLFALPLLAILIGIIVVVVRRTAAS